MLEDKNPQYWVEMDFIKDGVSLTLEEAQELMTDTTGMMGPLLAGRLEPTSKAQRINL